LRVNPELTKEPSDAPRPNCFRPRLNRLGCRCPWHSLTPRPARMRDGFEVYSPDKLEWKDGPNSLPKGARIAILEGDPAKEGPFVFRVRVPDGYRIPPHTHPKQERVTVVTGTFYVSMVDSHGVSDPKVMTVGSYGHWPPGMKHTVWTNWETILQFHGNGPWTIEYVNPDDDPRGQKKP
jgi:quercetin dioxygenase-like cupin family protein